MTVDCCEYCLSPKECRDHVIPVSYLGDRRIYNRSEYWIVDCCEQCNSLAGNKTFFSIPEKAKFILKRLKRRFSKSLNTPEWREEDLQEMDYALREMIFAHLVAKRVVLEKIKNLEVTIEKDREYLMPEFIKLRIKEWRLEHEKLIRKSRRRRKKIHTDISVL